MHTYKSGNRSIPRLENTILFFSSPFLYLPILLSGIRQRKSESVLYLAFLFGFISYLYIPGITNDKAKYQLMYETFLNYDFDGFVNYLRRTFRPDFILHLFLFTFAKMGINSNTFFLGITTYTVFSWLWLFTHKAKTIPENYSLYLLFAILSLSLPDLFSGIKFYFGSATLMWAYLYLDKKKYTIGALLVIVSVCTHFSLMVFGLILVVNSIFPNKNSYKWIFYCSLSFLLISKTSLISIIAYLNPIEVYNNKTQIYLAGEDTVLKRFNQGSENSLYSVVFSSLWIYFAYIYLIITYRKSSKFRNLVLLMISYVNLMFCVPTVFIRYIIIIKFLFALLYVREQHVYLKSYATRILLGLYFIGFCFNIVVMRNNLSKSLISSENLLITTLISSR
ncbi:EpsG-like putative glucosyltransferase [Flavobacterium sp. AG291]|nr:EpsG-like putative glucosyltransferase [Flavobacterium sp. AG291]